jgi:hypothetical protein
MLDFISSIAVLIAALTFIAGVSAWRREFVGKRRVELAESVLAMFYEAADAIRQIRNPCSFIGEGATRKRVENELAEDSRLLDQANIVFERYQKRGKLFSQIRSKRYRVMATFGTSAKGQFDELDAIINEVLNAAHMLGSHYWPRQGRVEMAPKEFKKHLMEMQGYEAVFWLTDEDKDTISPRVQKMIEKIENILQGAFVSQDDFVAGALDDIKSYAGMCGKLFKKQEPNNK